MSSDIEIVYHKKPTLFLYFKLLLRGPSSEKLNGALLGLRQFLATESPLKMMKNAFYIISKAHFVLKLFRFLS